MLDHRRSALFGIGGVLVALGGGLFLTQVADGSKSHIGDRAVVVSACLIVLGLILFLIGAFDRPRIRAKVSLEFLPPEIDETKYELGGYPYSVFNASIPIRNARESGGENRAAKRVKPEVEIFDSKGKSHQFRWVGWDNLGDRDFYPNHEEHRLFIAAKAEKSPFCIGTHQSAMFSPSLGHKNGQAFVDLEHWHYPGDAERLDGNKFLVRVTLRGENLRGVVRCIYKLEHEGVDGTLALTRAKKAHWWSRSKNLSSWSGGE